MANLVYKNTPYGDISILDSWPVWLRNMWLAMLKDYRPQVAGFVPAFIQGTVAVDNGQGQLIVTPLSPGEPFNSQLATLGTAQFLADKFGNGKVVEVPFGFIGARMSPDKAYHIQLKDDRTVNAGALASFYIRDPEDQFPGVAENMIRAMLA